VKDLWGNEIPDTDKPKPRSEYQRLKLSYGYHKANSWDVRKCKNCVYFQKHTKFFKCQLIGNSASEATDIRAGYVCRKHIYNGGKNGNR
jgi:hypothetical protein